MDSFEYNKILASVLVALLVGMTGSLISGYFIHPEKITKPLFEEGPESSAPAEKHTTDDDSLKPITPLLASASIDRGKTIAKKCTQCHTFEKDGSNKTGPNLWNIIGAKIAHAATFAYSAAFKEKGGTWDYEKLNIFLHKPRAFIATTKMSFVGLKEAQDRADIIAYLNSINDTPAPLPSPSP